MRPFVLALAAILAAGLCAQSVPATINYQGRLTDNTPAQAPVNATVPMSFAIYDAATAGTKLWQEPASGGTSVPVVNGIFNVALGAGGVAIPPSVFTGATSSRYLEITLNPGVSQEILTPRQLITSTGYANLAQNANSATTATTATTANSANTATTADSAANFTGPLTGDVTGTQSATSVVKIQGSAVPATGGAGQVPTSTGGAGAALEWKDKVQAQQMTSTTLYTTTSTNYVNSDLMLLSGSNTSCYVHFNTQYSVSTSASAASFTLSINGLAVSGAERQLTPNSAGAIGIADIPWFGTLAPNSIVRVQIKTSYGALSIANRTLILMCY